MNLSQAQQNVDDFFNTYRGWLPTLGRTFQKIREEAGEIKDALKDYKKLATPEHLHEIIGEVGDEFFYFICLASVLNIPLQNTLPIDSPKAPVEKISDETYNRLYILLKKIRKIRKQIKEYISEDEMSLEEEQRLEKDIEEIFFHLSTVAEMLGVSLQYCLNLTIEKKIVQAEKRVIEI